MLIYIIRHAETDSNVLKIIQGTTNTLLNQTGHHQSSLLADKYDHLQPSHIFCSDLDRCRETLKHLTDAIESKHGNVVETQYTPLLQERYMGELQGISKEEVEQLCNATGKSKFDFGETSEELGIRVRDFWTSLVLDKYSTLTEEDESILICSHGGTLLYLFRALITTYNFTIAEGVDKIDLNKSSGNTGVTILDTSSMKVLQYADVSHLLTTEDRQESSIENVDV